jgi:hypothetical protein
VVDRILGDAIRPARRCAIRVRARQNHRIYLKISLQLKDFAGSLGYPGSWKQALCKVDRSRTLPRETPSAADTAVRMTSARRARWENAASHRAGWLPYAGVDAASGESVECANDVDWADRWRWRRSQAPSPGAPRPSPSKQIQRREAPPLKDSSTTRSSAARRYRRSLIATGLRSPA